MIKHEVSLVNTTINQGIKTNMFPSNVVISGSISPIIDKAFLTNKSKKGEKIIIKLSSR